MLVCKESLVTHLYTGIQQLGFILCPLLVCHALKEELRDINVLQCHVMPYILA